MKHITFRIAVERATCSASVIDKETVDCNDLSFSAWKLCQTHVGRAAFSVGCLRPKDPKEDPHCKRFCWAFLSRNERKCQVSRRWWHPFVAWAKKGCRQTEPRTSFVKHHHLQNGMQRREKPKKINMLNNICLRGHQSFSDWFFP